MAKFKCAGRKRYYSDGTPYCIYESDERWLGRCPGCHRPYDCEKIGAEKVVVEQVATLATLQAVKPKPRLSMGIPEMDQVLGGGLPEGSTVFISGPPGTGKSTLLLTCANNVAEQKKDVIYASGEQNVNDIAEIAQRAGTTNARVRVLGMQSDVYEIMKYVEEVEPALLIIDSLAKMYLLDCRGDMGSAEQCKAITHVLVDFLKKRKTACICICHVNKGGELAGPKAAEHLVDGVLELDPVLDKDGTNFTDKRKLTSGLKNRLGASNVTVMFEMTAQGIRPAQPEPPKLPKLPKPPRPVRRVDDEDEPKKRRGFMRLVKKPREGEEA